MLGMEPKYQAESCYQKVTPLSRGHLKRQGREGISRKAMQDVAPFYNEAFSEKSKTLEEGQNHVNGLFGCSK